MGFSNKEKKPGHFWQQGYTGEASIMVSLATARTLSVRAWGLPRMGHCRVGQPARPCFWLLGVGVDAATGVAVKGSRRISGDLERS
jgi:hypothetical protein